MEDHDQTRPPRTTFVLHHHLGQSALLAYLKAPLQAGRSKTKDRKKTLKHVLANPGVTYLI